MGQVACADFSGFSGDVSGVPAGETSGAARMRGGADVCALNRKAALESSSVPIFDSLPALSELVAEPSGLGVPPQCAQVRCGAAFVRRVLVLALSCAHQEIFLRPLLFLRP